MKPLQSVACNIVYHPADIRLSNNCKWTEWTASTQFWTNVLQRLMRPRRSITYRDHLYFFPDHEVVIQIHSTKTYKKLIELCVLHYKRPSFSLSILKSLSTNKGNCLQSCISIKTYLWPTFGWWPASWEGSMIPYRHCQDCHQHQLYKKKKLWQQPYILDGRDKVQIKTLSHIKTINNQSIQGS